MSIEIIKTEIESLKEKIDTVERAINKGEEDYNKLDIEIKTLLTRQVIKGTDTELEQEIQKLKNDRITIQNNIGDFKAVKDGLQEELKVKGIELATAEKESAREQYNNLAEQRAKIDASIQDATKNLCAKLDELIALDKEQREVGKIAGVKCGRQINYIIEDWLSTALSKFHRAIGRPVYKLELTESDNLNKKLS